MSGDVAQTRNDVLVVEDDAFVARMLTVELAAAGYGVRVAHDGMEALDAAFERCPDLVLADVMMPKMDGFELVRRLRADPRTEPVSIILITARGQLADKLTGLSLGADDYVIKPFDNDELLARVAGVLRRAEYMRSQSPLTGLPGNVRIEDEIQARLNLGQPFAVMYLDIDNFKAFSDRYGFLRGDDALRSTGLLIRDAAKAVAGAGTFVGHIGGDDFVVVCDPARAEKVAREVIARFDALAPALYDEQDRARGGIEAEDRVGNARWFPLLTISIGVATTDARAFAHRAEAVGIATELKNFAKRDAASSYAMDRRRA